MKSSEFALLWVYSVLAVGILSFAAGSCHADRVWSTKAVIGGNAHYNPETGAWTWDGWKNDMEVAKNGKKQVNIRGSVSGSVEAELP